MSVFKNQKCLTNPLIQWINSDLVFHQPQHSNYLCAQLLWKFSWNTVELETVQFNGKNLILQKKRIEKIRFDLSLKKNTLIVHEWKKEFNYSSVWIQSVS